MKKITFIVILAALLVVPVPSAMADPPADGCARGFVLWDVDTEPYQVDNQWDLNGDGYACARAMGNRTATPPGWGEIPVYIFGDNSLPASY